MFHLLKIAAETQKCHQNMLKILQQALLHQFADAIIADKKYQSLQDDLDLDVNDNETNAIIMRSKKQELDFLFKVHVDIASD